MFKVPVYWFDDSGGEAGLTVALHVIPRLGDRINLTTLEDQIAELFPGEAKYLEGFRVLAIEHEATPLVGDGDQAYLDTSEPDLRVLIERDPEVQHQMELEEQRELADELRKHLSRLLNVLNCVVADAAESPSMGRFALVCRDSRDNPNAPSDLLAYQQESPFESSVPGIALEMADVVYVQKEGTYAEPRPYLCIKHRFRDFPFEVAWTGVR